MPTTPILGLTMMSASQAQKEVVFNQLAIAFDALFKGSVLDTTLMVPPASPVAGDAYIVAAGASGAWNGNGGKIAFYYNGWQFVSPSLKMRLYSVAQSEFFVYESGGVWTAEPASTVSVLGDLTNVTGAPTDGQVLKYQTSDSKWRPWTITFPPLALSALSDVNVTEGTGIDGKALVWNEGDLKWEPSPVLTSKPALLSLPDVNLTGVGEGNLLAYTASPPGLHFVATTSIITVASLDQVGDVAYPLAPATIPAGATLAWNGAAWAPSSEGATTIAITGLIDGPGPMGGNAGMVIRVNSVESNWEYAPFKLANLADVSVIEGAGIDGSVLVWSQADARWKAASHATNSLANLTDVNIPSEGAGIDGYALVWKNSDSKWEPKALATVAVSGAYADLTGKPALAPVATSGVYADLTSKPALSPVATSGNYGDLSGLPVIPVTLTMLGDINVTEGAPIDGMALVWNEADTMWEPGSVSASLHSLTDVNVTEGAGIDGRYLKWDNATSKWVASVVSAGAGALSALTDVSVTEGGSIDGYVLYWKNADSKWEAKALPSLATVATSGSYTDLSSKPSIPGNSAFNLAGLGDVNMSPGPGSDGYVVYWDNATARFKLKSASGGGGGSTTLSGDTDVAIASPTDGQVLTYHTATSKWINADPSGGTGGTVSGYATPSVVQSILGGGLGANSAVLVSNPTQGNLLVAFVTSQSLPSPGTGWSQVQLNTAGMDWGAIFVKIVGSGESKTQTPLSSTMNCQIGLYEIANCDVASSISALLSNISADQSSATPVSSGVMTNPKGLHLLMFAGSATGTATLNGGATVDATNTSIGGRDVVMGHCVSTYGGAKSFTATFSGAGTVKAFVFAAQPLAAAGSLAGANDAVITSPASGQILSYDSATAKWLNSSAANLPIHTISGASGTVAIDLTNGETQIVAITGSITSFVISNWGPSGTLSKLTLVLENSGAFTVALPSAKWAGGATPTVSSGAKTDLINFLTFDNGTTLYGNVVGQNYY